MSVNQFCHPTSSYIIWSNCHPTSSDIICLYCHLTSFDIIWPICHPSQTHKNLQACKQCLRTFFADIANIWPEERIIIFNLMSHSSLRVYNLRDTGKLKEKCLKFNLKSYNIEEICISLASSDSACGQFIRNCRSFQPYCHPTLK